MSFSQFVLSHQGVVEDLTGLLLLISIGYALIVVPVFVAHSRRELDKCEGDPMFGTRYARDPRNQPI